MNPLLLFFASGESLYPGAALMLVSIGASLYRPHLLRWLRSIVVWAALAMIVMACPPFPWGVDAVFGAAFFFWLTTQNRRARTPTWQKLQIAAISVLIVLLLLMPVSEFLHRGMPVIQGQRSDRLIVIGDSISSGLGNGVRPWPAVMQEMTDVGIVNLSKPGATAADGLAMAEQVTAQDRLVLVELGGNDLIAGEPSDIFARALEAILAKLASPTRVVVMFELPLLQQQVAYGRVQRRLSAQYDVWLIPKRYLTEVIARKEATSDGLHLTDVGARRMARVVIEALSPVLKMQRGSSITPATRP